MFSWVKKLIRSNEKLLSLYVHWPYCEAKCPYCDFNSHVNEIVDEKQWIKSYENQLIYMKEELSRNDIDFKNLNTVFFGGGTPSLMPLEIIENILDVSSKIFGFDKDVEITLEANPSSYDKMKFIKLKEIGINRLSIGVQSLNDKYLEFLGRLHNINDVNIATREACSIFDNISVDIIYAFYGQNLVEWTNELETFLKSNNLHHLSLYQLTIEEGTKFFKDYNNGIIKLIDDDLAAEFYNVSNQILNDFEFIKYEVSNYAKEGFRCKHNLNYWNSENWIGIGPGAFGRLWSSKSKSKCMEYQNYKNPKTWVSKNLFQTKFDKITELDYHVSDTDTLIMGLRLYEGLDISKLNNKSIINYNSLKHLKEQKIVSLNENILKVNEEHMIKLNSIVDYLINP